MTAPVIGTATGTSAVITHVVRDADCATAWANDLPVLATPVLLWLAEVASMRVIDADLSPGEMSVGCTHRAAEHLAATPAGWTVTVTATLVRAGERILEFEVEARDTCELVYRGVHERAVIDRDRFLQRLDRKLVRAAGVT